MSTPRQTGAVPVQRGSKRTVDIPSWHPPYEIPIQLQYPVHFDDSATRHRMLDSHFDYERWQQLGDEFDSTVQTRPGVAISIEYVTAITGAARMSGEEPLPRTPSFFAVTVFEKYDYASVHGDIVKLCKKYFGDRELVVRYFAGWYVVHDYD